MNAAERTTDTSCLMRTYRAYSRIMVRGAGTRLYDQDGREYLDFLSGLGVNNLGHCHPAIVEAVQRQAATLIHACNLYGIELQLRLAEELCRRSIFDKVFFCNSGAEAMDGALKLARLHAWNRGERKRTGFLAMEGSFHGRTFGAMSVTSPRKVREGFEPLPAEARFARFNDAAHAAELADDSICAVVVEPVIGEGGVIPATREFLQALRELCDARGMALIFDEVQCGLGRIGWPFAYEHFGVEPDIVTLAKGLAGGLPMGAILARGDWSATFQPGQHGATFGGNPLSASAALAYLGELFDKRLWERAAELGEYLTGKLRETLKPMQCVKEVRGLGLMLGIVLDREAAPVVRKALEHGLLVNDTAERVIRLLPPFIITREECDRAVEILHECLNDVKDDAVKA
ncbi:aspartate aminotransferase family protein [Candidatus Sumerlaeota bacterium]|nr:aspartate aminotransferase family protein [Candidatus Sumerlaeota bacterium]